VGRRGPRARPGELRPAICGRRLEPGDRDDPHRLAPFAIPARSAHWRAPGVARACRRLGRRNLATNA